MSAQVSHSISSNDSLEKTVVSIKTFHKNEAGEPKDKYLKKICKCPKCFKMGGAPETPV